MKKTYVIRIRNRAAKPAADAGNEAKVATVKTSGAQARKARRIREWERRSSTVSRTVA